MLWETQKPTKEILNTMEKYYISKQNQILDLGCGEGRDAIYLLKKGYNMYALDYSKNAINKCKELSEHKFDNRFIEFDILTSSLNKKFDFIYSICVLHMFVDNIHRKKFWKFIEKHLSPHGKALIIVMGNGTNEYTSNIEEAFKPVKRININSKKEITVSATTCRIINWINLKNEIKENNLKLLEDWNSTEVPSFSETMCCVVEKEIQNK